MKRLRVGVLGVGHLGSLHARMYAEIPSAEFIGVMDTDAARADAIARDLHVASFRTAEDLLNQVSAVSIAAPTRAHFELARLAIQAGVHVLIEKPMASTIEEASSIVKLAKEKKVKVQIGHIERFNPALLALQKYELRPMFVESHRLAQFNPRGTDVAVVLDLMIHDIDIIVSLVHSPVASIEANGVAVVSDTIDIANARIQFENGCVANVTASRISQKKMRKMRLFQKDAYISIDFSEGLAEVFRLRDDGDTARKNTMLLGEIDSGAIKRSIVYEQPEVKEVNALKYELERFVDAVQHDREPPVTGAEGLRALTLAHDIMDRIDRKKLVL
ncbi:MAG TPA: Gfo/Idh/MocA family oxidoreductase [Bacteroidota bacterium]|nr:Gfo/Idh/MocA family oxidoreductase [Bacteroidota bacterium]